MPILMRLAGAILICAATVSTADTAKAQSSRLEKARELFQIFEGNLFFQEMLDLALSNMNSAIRQVNPNLPIEASRIIREEVEAAMLEGMPRLLDRGAILYERMFTEEELDELLEFCRGPTGQSFISKLPAMLNNSWFAKEPWADEMMQALPGLVEQRLKAAGYDL